MKKRKIVSIVGLLVSSHLLATLLAVEVEIGVRWDHRPPSVGIVVLGYGKSIRSEPDYG